VIRIFVGYDSVESVAYHTLCQSIIENTTVPVSITPVKLSMLPAYKRLRNPKQSNEFSFSRFMVPYLCNYDGWGLFMDCDMMFRTDVNELWQLRDPSKSVQVVKHDYTPKNQTKFLGAIQYPYPRKNWSSVMLFNCAHQDCRRLTPSLINTAEPLFLHRMHWTNDDMVGELPREWNHLVGEYPYDENAKNVHWTVGGPYFKEYNKADYHEEWFEMYEKMTNCNQLEKRDAG
jgi:lipopolysaccharide biosynthesis glycosyltransferase